MLPRAKTLLGALVVESRWCREVAGEKFPRLAAQSSVVLVLRNS